MQPTMCNLINVIIYFIYLVKVIKIRLKISGKDKAYNLCMFDFSKAFVLASLGTDVLSNIYKEQVNIFC